MKQPLPLRNLLFQLLHATAVLFELLAVTPAVSGMLLLLLLEIAHRAGLGQHFTSQVVLRRRHVVAPGHMGNRKSKTTTGLIPMPQLPSPIQLR